MKKLLFISVCVALVFSAKAQKYVFSNYGVDEGLAQSQVRSLFQDSKGDLWIGTLGGVSKFNGIEFSNFNTSNGLLRNQIDAISEAPNGDIILGTLGGISIYNGRAFKNYEFAEAFSRASVNDVIFQSDSALIATSEGLFSYRKDKVLRLSDYLSLSDNNIKCIKPIDNGFIILSKTGIYSWINNEVTELFNTKNLSEILNETVSSFMDMAITKENHFYIATPDNGVIFIQDNSAALISTSQGLASSVCSDLVLDQNDLPIVATKNGFSHMKLDEIISFKETNGLTFEDVRAVLQDENGNIWAGTNGAGLYKFSGYAFTYFDQDEGLSSPAIMTISRQKNGEMLFGTYDGGISIAGENTWSYIPANELTNNRIWTQCADSTGRIYTGSSGGIDIIKEGKVIDQITVKDGLNYKKVTALYTDKDNQIWIGTSRGINLYHEGEISQFKNFEGDRIRDIMQSKTGSILMASRQGIWEYENNEFELLNLTSGLNEPLVYCIEETDLGMFFGTKNGLWLSKNDTLSQIHLSDNYNANIINFLTEDSDGNVWAGTNYGLFRIDQHLAVTGFSKQDGLINLETNLNAVFSEKNALWFGTSSALQRIDLKELNKLRELESPEIKLNEIRLNLKETNWENYTDFFISGTKVPSYAHVGHQMNNFQFFFSTDALEAPEKIQYQYMLEGYDNEWQPASQSNFATYTNLPFTSLKFKVRARRIGQDWGKTFSYNLRIKPPFWQTWWFLTLATLALIYTSYSIFQYRRKNLITQLEKEKFELKSKMLSLEQQSLNSSMNRHFIFNALNSIQYYINRQDKLAANKYLSSFAKLIRKNLDSSQVNFTTLADELERLELYLEIENMRFKDKFEYQITVSDDIDEEATQIPSMLLQPYLENSIWHGILPQEKKGEIRLDISKNPLGQMEIRIKDNGIGINTSQAQKNGTASHISKGMNITNGRIQLLQNLTHQKVILIGPFELKNDAGIVLGTQVTIKLPLKYNSKHIE